MSKYPECPYMGNVEGAEYDEPTYDYGTLSVDGVYSPTAVGSTIDLPVPSGYTDGKWVDESIIHKTFGENRREYIYKGQFRYQITLIWDYEDVDNMHIILGALNHLLLNADNVIRLYPHKSSPYWYYLVNIVDHNLHNYLTNRPAGYGGLSMSFRGAHTTDVIPQYDPYAYKEFTNSTLPEEVDDMQTCMFGDSTETNYSIDEKLHMVGLFTSSQR